MGAFSGTEVKTRMGLVGVREGKKKKTTKKRMTITYEKIYCIVHKTF